MHNYKYVYFGTPTLAKEILEKLCTASTPPTLIVTNPPQKQGRGMHLADSPVAIYAQAQHIPYLTPEKITTKFCDSLNAQGPWDFFIVVAYGKILPQKLLNIVSGKVLNIHPSILPKYRGPSPLESVLLSDDTETGVSLMQIDALVDHGPTLEISTFPLSQDTTITELRTKTANVGAELILKHIDAYANNTTLLSEQDHTLATFTHKIQKEDGDITHASAWESWKKYRALKESTGVYFFAEYRHAPIRVKVLSARWDNDFIIETVVPENKKPLQYDVFLKWLSA